jgi:hypothetical protein
MDTGDEGLLQTAVFTLIGSVTSSLLGAFALAVSAAAAFAQLVTVKLAWRCHAVGRLDGR